MSPGAVRSRGVRRLVSPGENELSLTGRGDGVRLEGEVEARRDLVRLVSTEREERNGDDTALEGWPREVREADRPITPVRSIPGERRCLTLILFVSISQLPKSVLVGM